MGQTIFLGDVGWGTGEEMTDIYQAPPKMNYTSIAVPLILLSAVSIWVAVIIFTMAEERERR